MGDKDDLRGLWSRIWVGGTFLIDTPTLSITPQPFETATRTSNRGLRIDRPLGEYPGLPGRFEKFAVSFSWKDISTREQLDYLQRLESASRFFDLGIFKPIHDTYSGDGSTRRFLIPRRTLRPTVMPDVDLPRYVTRVRVYDRAFYEPGETVNELTVVDKTAAAIDTGDPTTGLAWVESDGHQENDGRWYATVRLSPDDDAPADGFDNLVVSYCALLKVAMVSRGPRNYGEDPGREAKTFQVAEV